MAGISQYKLSKDLNIPPTTYGTWVQKDRAPRVDRLNKRADYFNVSVDYLMNGDTKKEWKPELTEKDERDLKTKLNDILNSLDSDTGLMFDGEPLDEETRELFTASLEHALRTAKIAAKKKYTPKKYRK